MPHAVLIRRERLHGLVPSIEVWPLGLPTQREVVRQRQLHRPALEKRNVHGVHQRDLFAGNERAAAVPDGRVELAERRDKVATEGGTLDVADARVACAERELGPRGAQGRRVLNELLCSCGIGGGESRVMGWANWSGNEYGQIGSICWDGRKWA